MATLEVPSNVKCITSGQVPTTTNLKDGEFAFGKVGGVAKLYGNVNGVIIDFTGDSATIDANTLLALLLGSNGIAIAKNAAGDKVEVKLAIPETGPITLTNNNVPRPAISIEVADGGPPAFGGITISNATDSDKVVRLGPRQVLAKSGVSELTFDANGITSRDNGNEVGHGLISGGPKGNVKTLFGNQQSIYGSGNIDLYRHSLYIHFECKLGSDTRQIQMYVQLISSSNTNIDSLTDLFSMFSNIKDIPASGTVTGGLGQNGVCVSVTEFSMSGKIITMLVDGGGVQYDISSATLQSIRDTVTTV